MLIKNVSKKIIGNKDFRLLPGGTMTVSGDEVWVQDYMEEGKLEKAAEKKAKKSAKNDSKQESDPDAADDASQDGEKTE